MILPFGRIAIIVVGAVVFLAALRLLSWRVLVEVMPASGQPSILHRLGAWPRIRRIRALLRLGYPRVYATLAARLARDRFSGLPLTLVVLGCLYIAALLGGLTEEVMEASGVVRFDHVANDFLTPFRDRRLVAAFLWITALGAGPALTAVAATATSFLWATRRTADIAPLWIAFLGAQATTWSGKYFVARHRPDFIQAVSEASPSFPSGHATGSMALFGFLAYALARDMPDPRNRFELVFWTAMLILAIDFSRIFLSVHYLSDVAAGGFVGAFWLLVGLAFDQSRRPRFRTDVQVS